MLLFKYELNYNIICSILTCIKCVVDFLLENESGKNSHRFIQSDIKNDNMYKQHYIKKYVGFVKFVANNYKTFILLYVCEKFAMHFH